MTLPIFPADSGLLVADASTVINLNATGCAPSIISALPNRIYVVDMIPEELDTGRPRGHRDASQLQELIANGFIDCISLSEAGWEIFEQLVSGPACDTLDDGEAATIAHAAVHGAAAVIDEAKATRICGEKLPHLRLITTVDVLLHPAVRASLGEERLGNALFAALTDARMRVFPQHIQEVVRIIRPDRAALCHSLPRRSRPVPEPGEPDAGERTQLHGKT